jgi:hypothetical protein
MTPHNSSIRFETVRTRKGCRKAIQTAGDRRQENISSTHSEGERPARQGPADYLNTTTTKYLRCTVWTQLTVRHIAKENPSRAWSHTMLHRKALATHDLACAQTLALNAAPTIKSAAPALSQGAPPKTTARVSCRDSRQCDLLRARARIDCRMLVE